MLDKAGKLNLIDHRRAAIGFCFGGGNVLELARDGADIAAAVSIHGDLKTAEAAKPGAVKAALLVTHGAPDPVVPKADRDAFEAEMEAAGAKWQMLVFSGVLHAYTDEGIQHPGHCRLERAGDAADLRADAAVHRRRVCRETVGRLALLFERQQSDDVFRRDRLLLDLNAERPERVVDGSPDRTRRADGSGFADAFGAQQCCPGRRRHMGDVDVGHFRRHRDDVVGKTAVEELPLRRVGAVLVKRGANSLHGAAAELLVDQQRIDHASAIFHDPEVEDLDHAGVCIDLHRRGLDAVCHNVGHGLRDVACQNFQWRDVIERNGVRPIARGGGDFCERYLFGAGRVDHRSVADGERGCGLLQQ